MFDKYLIEAIVIAFNYFRDPEKVSDWFGAKNLYLDGVSPASLVMMGRTKKILECIIVIVEEKRREDDIERGAP